MLDNISLLIFDLDFTLVDSSYGIVRCMNDALKDFSKELGEELRLDYEQIRPLIGKEPVDDHFRRFLTPDKHHLVPKLVERFLQISIEVMPRYCKLMPFTKEVLTHYSEKGYGLAIVSFKKNELSDAILSFLDLRRFFEVTVGRGDAKQKPEPDLILLVLNKTGIDKDRAVVIGDAVNDVIAGKKAGVKTIGITTGISSKDELEKAGADYIIDNLIQLFEIVN